jgi:hypothetical protein
MPIGNFESLSTFDPFDMFTSWHHCLRASNALLSGTTIEVYDYWKVYLVFHAKQQKKDQTTIFTRTGINAFNDFVKFFVKFWMKIFVL